MTNVEREVAEEFCRVQRLGAKAVRGLRIDRCAACGLVVEAVQQGVLEPHTLREWIERYRAAGYIDFEGWLERRRVAAARNALDLPWAVQ